MRIAAAVAFMVLMCSVSAHADTFKLANGDQVTGDVVERTQDTITLQSPILGRIEVPVAQLAPEKPPRPGLFGTSFLAGWKRTFRLGMNGEGGDSTTADATTGLSLRYEDEERRWRIDTAYFYSRADSEQTKSNGFISAERDWLFSDSPWFAFAGARGDYDAFRSWEYRVQGKGGVGYEFVKTKDFSLRGRLGPSITQEFKADRFLVEALAGVDLAWKVNDKLSVEAHNTIYPALNKLGSYRNVTALGWKWMLAKEPALSLDLGVENEYQTDVASGNRHNDLKYYGTVGLDF